MSSFCNAKAIHIFSAKNISVFAIFQDRNFNVTLANNFVWALSICLKKLRLLGYPKSWEDSDQSADTQTDQNRHWAPCQVVEFLTF